MKKYSIIIAILAIMTACGNNNDKAAAPAPAPATVGTDLSANPDYQKGLELIAKSDCLTCHKVNEKLIGPAYKEVAKKYEATDENIALLASKVIKGGSGVWGAVPMTAHATLSEADAKQMVKYVLLLRNK